MFGWSIFATASIAILTLWIAFVASRLLARLNAFPDYSYGIYIYGYPIQQMTSVLLPGWTPIAQVVVSFLGTIVPASLSWHFIERPALALKSTRIYSTVRGTAQ
jgi:peptidoglycan/LPS O-acetylase OafA/YrhL